MKARFPIMHSAFFVSKKLHLLGFIIENVLPMNRRKINQLKDSVKSQSIIVYTQDILRAKLVKQIFKHEGAYRSSRFGIIKILKPSENSLREKSEAILSKAVNRLYYTKRIDLSKNFHSGMS